MKVVSWNVQGRVREALTRQIGAVVDRGPDVLALQEVTPATLPTWRAALEDDGYYVESTCDLAAAPYPAPPYPAPPFPPPRKGRVHDRITRRNFNLTAARGPIERLDGLAFPDPDEARFAFPEKYLGVRVTVGGVPVVVHNTHLPPGASRGVLKVHAFEAIRRRVDADVGLRVLCGDFNAPWSEDADGARTRVRRRWPDEVRSRWEAAEAAIFAPGELRDVYRDVHGTGEPFPVSHWTGRGDRRIPHRYDYIFASRELEVVGCEYLTDWLEPGQDRPRMSDHAAVEATLVARAADDRRWVDHAGDVPEGRQGG